MSYFMIRSAAGYLQSGSRVAVAAPAAGAVRRESGRATHLPAVCCDVGGRRWHRGHPGRAGLGNPVLRPVHPVPGGCQPVRGPHDHGLHHGDTDAVPVRGAAGARTTEVLGKLTFTSLARALVDLTSQSLL